MISKTIGKSVINTHIAIKFSKQDFVNAFVKLVCHVQKGLYDVIKEEGITHCKYPNYDEIQDFHRRTINALKSDHI